MSILSKIFKTKKAAKVEKKPNEKKLVNVQAASAPKKETARPIAQPPGKKKQDPRNYQVISNPLVTEKATDLAALNKYIFVVPTGTNKSEVLKKIFNIYGVKPIKVNFVKKTGKKVRYGRVYGKTMGFKKAIVTLAPQDKIEVYEGV